MRKIFIFDTNVILFDPQAIYKFGGHEVVIPITVIEEIDHFKKDLNENGRNARQFSRIMDQLRKKGDLATGVPLNESGLLRVELSHHAPDLPAELVSEKADNRILAVAFKALKERGKDHVVFITKDTNLRIKADALGISSEDYDLSSVPIEELYSGIGVFEVSAEAISTFYSDKKLPIEDDMHLYPNQFVILRDESNPSHSAIGRYDLRHGSIVPHPQHGRRVGLASKKRGTEFRP